MGGYTAWSEPHTRSPSGWSIGSPFTRDPVATITCRASSTRSLPPAKWPTTPIGFPATRSPGAATITLCGPPALDDLASRPHPATSSTPFFRNRYAIPFAPWSATVRARRDACARSRRTSPTVIPKSARCSTRAAYAALSSSALVGIHPTLLQTPPSCAASTHAVRSLRCAARIAATYPPGPAPSTMTSKVSVSAIRHPSSHPP